MEEEDKQKTYNWAEEMELFCSEEGDITTINENPEYPPSVHPVLPNIKMDPKTDLKQTQNWMENRPLMDLLLL